MFEAADAARVRAARRPGAKPYAGACVGEWTLRNPRNAREGSETVPRETLRWSDWANALNGQRLVSWVREEVFPFHAGIAAEGVTDFMADARLVIDEPTVLSQVVSHVNDLHLEQVDAERASPRRPTSTRLPSGATGASSGEPRGRTGKNTRPRRGAVLVQAAFGVPVDDLANHYGFAPLWACGAAGRLAAPADERLDVLPEQASAPRRPLRGCATATAARRSRESTALTGRPAPAPKESPA